MTIREKVEIFYRINLNEKSSDNGYRNLIVDAIYSSNEKKQPVNV